MNALWNANYGSNIRILLLNNSGGEIFHALPGLELHENARRFVTATHQTSAKAWAEDRGFTAVAHFVQPSITNRPMLFEVFTDKAQDVEKLKEYYHNLKH